MSTLRVLLGLAAVALCACSDEIIIPPPDVSPSRDNTLVWLGQLLFFDKELSGNRNISCATCHVPSLASAEPLELSIGQGGHGSGPTRTLGDGTLLPRNTPALFFLGSPPASALFWDGRVEWAPDGGLSTPVDLSQRISTPLEAVSYLHLLDRAVMRGFAGDRAVDGRPNELAEVSDEQHSEVVGGLIVTRLLGFPEYASLFAAAFPYRTPTIEHVVRALAAFQRDRGERLDARYDEFVQGLRPLDDAAERGRVLFFGDAGCARCHSGTAFSDFAFHNIAVPQIGPGHDGDMLDVGRARVTGAQQDRFAFRTPSLRNVRLSPPYMHDGAFATLEDAVRHHLDPEASLRAYDGAALPSTLRALLHNDARTADLILETLDPATVPLRPLSDEEVHDILRFLTTLDGRRAVVYRGSDLDVPLAVPSGLPVDR